MKRIALLAAGVAALVASSAPAAPPRLDGFWSGTMRLPTARDAVDLSLQVRGTAVTVSLGAGHPARTVVRGKRAGTRLTFALPGRPTALAFDGRLRNGTLAGSTRLGAQRGTFSLRRTSRLAESRWEGVYRLASGTTLAVAKVFETWHGVDYGADEVHALYAKAPGVYDVGAGYAARTPVVGEARFGAAGVTWRGVPGERIDLRQVEVRFRSGSATLAGTLTLPSAAGARPAVAFVHGSGETPRETAGTVAQFLAARGFVVLTYDKRGVGQSGGTFPGEAASERNVDVYARDAEAAARFLAGQPEVDRARVGLAGGSQAGWIMPLAAVRERAVRFLIAFVGPTVTQGESDLWGSLTGQGESIPSAPLESLEQEVRRAGKSGFDPLPSIRALTIPALWLYGANDMHVPTRLSVERLEPLTREPGHDLSYVVFPGGNHGLLVTEHGLTAEADRSSSLVRGLFATIAGWLEQRGLAPTALSRSGGRW